jgi:RND family efflux transporter MFP subunit
MRSNGLKITVFGIMACTAIGGALFAAQAPAQSSSPTRSSQRLASGEVDGQSAPSDPRDLAFAQPGLISEVNVKDGDVIKKGQVLASQDTSVEEAALAREEFLLKSNVQKRAAVAQLELARVKLGRFERLLKQNGAGSQAEYDEAKLEVTVSELKVELAEEETESKRLEIVRLRKQIERMKIISQFDGAIRKVELAVGEVSDPQKPSIIAVSNHPLHVNTAVPTTVANTLKIGQRMQVRYLGEETWREATVKSLDPVADATRGRRAVKLEMPNPENRPAGEEMAVKLPTDLASAKE